MDKQKFTELAFCFIMGFMIVKNFVNFGKRKVGDEGMAYILEIISLFLLCLSILSHLLLIASIGFLFAVPSQYFKLKFTPQNMRWNVVISLIIFIVLAVTFGIGTIIIGEQVIFQISCKTIEIIFQG